MSQPFPGLSPRVFESFAQEIEKRASAGKGVAELLSTKAVKSGLRPSMIPAIRQAASAASSDRGRAAEIARNVRNFLKSKAA